MPTTKLGRVRWISAAAIFLGVTVVVVLSYFPSIGVQSCHQELASNGTNVEVCGPIGVGDLVVVALLLGIAGLLIWPDLSELSIANLISLKKQADATEAKTAKAADDIRGLALAQSAPAEDDVSRVVQGFAAAAVIVPASSEPRILSAERSAIEKELLGLVPTLDRLLAIPSAPNPADALSDAQTSGLVATGSTTSQLAILDQWQSRFDSQLRTWASLRNQVVHFPERLSDQQVRQGLELGNRLLHSARSELRAASQGD